MLCVLIRNASSELTLNYPKFAAIESKGLKDEFETAMVNEPLVFGSPNAYWIWGFSSLLTNDIVGFEQLGPDWLIVLLDAIPRGKRLY